MSQTTTTMTVCKRHGEYEQTVTTIGSGANAITHRVPWSCPTCQQEREAEDAARRRREWIAANRKRAQIPFRFTDCSFDNYEGVTPGQRRALSVAKGFAEKFAEMYEAGHNLTFHGKPGTGKTHLACAIANHLLDAGGTVIYEQAHELIRAIRDTWRRDSRENETAVVGRYRAANLLILDEVGKSLGGEAEKTQLFDVLDGRYRQKLPTLLISNLGATGLRQCLGEWACDRLTENGSYVVMFDWGSYRREAHPARRPNPKPSLPAPETDEECEELLRRENRKRRQNGVGSEEKSLSERLEEAGQL